MNPKRPPPGPAQNLRAPTRRRPTNPISSFTLPPIESYEDYPSSDYRPTRTRTGTYGLNRSPSPLPPRGTETPGHYHLTADPEDYQLKGRYGLCTPSTSSTGQCPWSSSLLTHHRSMPAAPRLGRAPWPGLAHVLEKRTASNSPPPVELSVYHPLQTMTPTRPATPIPSSTETSPKPSESS